jgi:transcriptional regulator with XRE-family HTH domain
VESLIAAKQQECLQCRSQTFLLATGSKILCVKTLGELVKKWREDSGLSRADLARRVGVEYESIRQLEGASGSKRVKQPRYIGDLAKAMGTTADDLLALRMPPALKEGKLVTGSAASGASAASYEVVAAPKTGLVLAIATIAEAMEQAPEVRRDAAAPLLSRLATKPREQEQIAATLLAIIGNPELAAPRNAPPKDPAAGQAPLTAWAEDFAARAAKIKDRTLRASVLSKADDLVEKALDKEKPRSKVHASQAAAPIAPDTETPSRTRERTRNTRA